MRDLVCYINLIESAIIEISKTGYWKKDDSSTVSKEVPLAWN
jgi:hypothetical protein